MPETLRVKCPRCGRLWAVYDGEPEVDCNCQTYCEEGSKPSDCALIAPDNAAVPDRWRGFWNWPQGMHMGRDKETDDVRGRIMYCTTHSKFVTKQTVTIPVDWSVIQGRKRIDKNVRFDREV